MMLINPSSFVVSFKHCMFCYRILSSMNFRVGVFRVYDLVFLVACVGIGKGVVSFGVNVYI